MERPAHLTNRDLRIITMAHTYGGVTADLIQRRFFPTRGARSACYSRLARLIASGYLTSVRLPSFSGIGSGKAFLTPGPNGRPLLAHVFGVSRSQLARRRLDSPPYIVPHHLAIGDFRLSLELAAERSRQFSVKEFWADHELRVRPTRVIDPENKKVICFVPDGAFTLVLPDGRAQSFLLELDLATLAPKRLREKLRGYLIQAKQQPTPVLFVTLNRARLDAIVRYAQEEAERLKTDPTIFWLATRDRVTEQTVLQSPIWQIVGGPSAIALCALASVAGRPLAVEGRALREEGVRL